MHIYLNGDWVADNEARVSVFDRGFIFGDGVYEVIPVYANRPFRLTAHIARLKRSLAETRIETGYDDSQWIDVLEQLARRLPCGDGKDVSETCTVITTLLNHQAAPADQVRDTYLTRRGASETTFGEDKTTITGAGNRTSGPVLRSGSPRLVIQEAWAWLTATQLVRASEAAALRSGHAAAWFLAGRGLWGVGSSLLMVGALAAVLG